MDDRQGIGACQKPDSQLGWPLQGIPVHALPQRRRGRPPGISPQRRAMLAHWVREGLSLGEIAHRLGVSRQCIHVQLRKCPELEALRREARARMSAVRDVQKQEQAAWEALLFSKRRGAKPLVKFLLEARSRGWNVVVRPRKRPRINGVPLAFHCPSRSRPASNGQKSKAHYYHIRITRTDWLHVVYLPSGRYVIWLPGSIHRAGSIYIPISRASTTTSWPRWPVAAELTQSAA